jgi:hypothetical protein
VATDEDGLGGANYRTPLYRVAGEVQPGLVLVREEVGVQRTGEPKAGGESEEQDEGHTSHARAQEALGSERKKDGKCREIYQE